MNLGPMHWLLGMEVKRDHTVQTISLSQKAYISSIIMHFHLKDATSISTPMEAGVQLVQAKNDTSTSPHILYKEIIGSLMYTATVMQPDLAFVVLALAQFVQDPARPHWEATKCVIRYVKGMRDLELTYGATNTGIIRYTDGDLALQYHWHSISGYTFLVNGGTVSWSSKKQLIVALSTTKAEYVATTHTTKEALWLCSFLGEITR